MVSFRYVFAPVGPLYLALAVIDGLEGWLPVYLFLPHTPYGKTLLIGFRRLHSRYRVFEKKCSSVEYAHYGAHKDANKTPFDRGQFALHFDV